MEGCLPVDIAGANLGIVRVDAYGRPVRPQGRVAREVSPRPARSRGSIEIAISKVSRAREGIDMLTSLVTRSRGNFEIVICWGKIPDVGFGAVRGAICL